MSLAVWGLKKFKLQRRDSRQGAFYRVVGALDREQEQRSKDLKVIRISYDLLRNPRRFLTLLSEFESVPESSTTINIQIHER